MDEAKDALATQALELLLALPEPTPGEAQACKKQAQEEEAACRETAKVAADKEGREQKAAALKNLVAA